VKSLLVAGLMVLASCGSAGASRTIPDAPSPRAHAAQSPHTASGRPLQLVASGLQVPTAFAFGAGHVFEADDGNHAGTVNGGVFVLSSGHARLLPGSPLHAFGLAWNHGWLYLSTFTQLLRWGAFNGSRFTVQQTLYTAPAHFSGFDGIGFGANGRLYAGVSAGDYDHGPVDTPYALDVLTFNPTGGGLRVFARGIRQPWQMAFPAGSSSPFVSDLGQDSAAANPPDFVMRAHQGDNFGYWRCNWTSLGACHGYTRPLVFLRPHTDAMGLGIIGSRLYASEYGAVYAPQVVSMNFAGHGIRTEASGFSAPIVGLGISAGRVYVGASDGRVWRFRPGT
jgi:glucose/arabinose dehydrogenase